MELSRRIELPVRSALIAEWDNAPLAGYFACREDAYPSGPVQEARCRRFHKLCEAVTEMARQHGRLEEFEALTIGDENSPGFRVVFDFVVARITGDVHRAMRRIMSLFSPLPVERRGVVA